jgi:broad specificity phosphatase PhoE
MKKYIVLIIFVFTTIASFSQEIKEGITTYYLIRHAEKNRTDATNKDAHLTDKGTKRADHWAAVLSSANINMVYTTAYNRTTETAQPTATKNGLEKMHVYNPNKMYDASFKHATKGKNVLVVGHSNTTPFFANKILGKDLYKQIEDNNNSNLYIVTVSKNGATSVVLKINH